MKLESINFWFNVFRVSVSHSVCQIMDLGTAIFTFLRRLKCPLSLSSEQQKVSSEFLEKIKLRKFFGPKIFVCVI